MAGKTIQAFLDVFRESGISSEARSWWAGAGDGSGTSLITQRREM